MMPCFVLLIGYVLSIVPGLLTRPLDASASALEVAVWSLSGVCFRLCGLYDLCMIPYFLHTYGLHRSRERDLTVGASIAGKRCQRPLQKRGNCADWECIACRLGVLVEVNCETDFVARGDQFKELVQDIAMQIAASPTVDIVTIDEAPQEELERERALEMQKEDIQSKPEAIRCAAIASWTSPEPKVLSSTQLRHQYQWSAAKFPRAIAIQAKL